jgi:CheY-like chemotaxis protein
MPDTPRILIVDDNFDHRLLLTYQLARIGAFDIREAEDGPQGLAALAAAPPDLVFMNLRLPRLDGWEVIRRVRALAAPLGQVPIIAFTAYVGGWAEQRARQAGCDAYLVKPLRDAGLLRQVVTALLARGPRP